MMQRRMMKLQAGSMNGNGPIASSSFSQQSQGATPMQQQNWVQPPESSTPGDQQQFISSQMQQPIMSNNQPGPGVMMIPSNTGNFNRPANINRNFYFIFQFQRKFTFFRIANEYESNDQFTTNECCSTSPNRPWY
jgi:hypothetical protein